MKLLLEFSEFLNNKKEFKDFLFVKIPFENIINYEIIGFYNEISEKEAECIVDKRSSKWYPNIWECYTPHWKKSKHKGNGCSTAKASLESLIESLGLKLTDEILILKNVKKLKLNENINYNEFKSYLDQMKNKEFMELNKQLWKDIKDEGFPYDIDDLNINNYKFITIDISDNDKKGLVDMEEEYLNKWNKFDNYIKDNGYYPEYLDFIDYDNGIIYIVKHINN